MQSTRDSRSAALTIATTSLVSKMADVEANLNKALDVIAEAAAREAEIVVFPETFLTGYTAAEKESKFLELAKLAEPVPGPSTTALVEQARKHDIYVAIGLIEANQEHFGTIHNSAVFLGPEGILQVYRKVHLGQFGPFRELHCGWSQGDRFSVFNIKQNWNIGMSICYDTFSFPEGPRLMTLKGMDVLITISASPSTTKESWYLVNQVRAIENGVFHIFANAVGEQGDSTFFGGAMLISPYGTFLAKGKVDEEDLIVATLSAEELFKWRQTRLFLRDRQPRAYQGIV